jgi:hypothetical protein
MTLSKIRLELARDPDFPMEVASGAMSSLHRLLMTGGSAKKLEIRNHQQPQLVRVERAQGSTGSFGRSGSAMKVAISSLTPAMV